MICRIGKKGVRRCEIAGGRNTSKKKHCGLGNRLFDCEGRMERMKISTQFICAIVYLTLLGAMVPLTSDAQEAEDASYFCKSEMAAGLTYNSRLKKWEGVQLSSESSFSKFILRMKFMNERVRRNVLGEEEDVIDYEVTVTEAEANNSFSCRSVGSGVNSKIIVVGDEQNVVCSARTYSFTFNLENNRFISVYLHGYVDGVDSNENTPMLSGGTCTKIDQGK